LIRRVSPLSENAILVFANGRGAAATIVGVPRSKNEVDAVEGELTVAEGEVTADPSEGSWQDRAVERSINSARLKALARSSQFLAAGLELLEETGEIEFTVQDIVDRSNLSLRAFYQHFASKDDLLLSLFEEVVTQFTDEIAKDLDQIDDPFDRLETYVDRYFHRAHGSLPFGGRAMTIYQMRLAAERPDDYGKAITRQVQVLHSIIRHGIDRGEFRSDLPEMAVTLLLNATLVSMAQMDVFNIKASDGPISYESIWAWCRSAVAATGGPRMPTHDGASSSSPPD
jgi:AcrR family transcriptional regulator